MGRGVTLTVCVRCCQEARRLCLLWWPRGNCGSPPWLQRYEPRVWSPRPNFSIPQPQTLTPAPAGGKPPSRVTHVPAQTRSHAADQHMTEGELGLGWVFFFFFPPNATKSSPGRPRGRREAALPASLSGSVAPVSACVILLCLVLPHPAGSSSPRPERTGRFLHNPFNSQNTPPPSLRMEGARESEGERGREVWSEEAFSRCWRWKGGRQGEGGAAAGVFSTCAGREKSEMCHYGRRLTSVPISGVWLC